LVQDCKWFWEHLPDHSESAGGYYKEYPIRLRGGNGTGEPEFSNDLIAYNGDDETGNDLAHETFYFERVIDKEDHYRRDDPPEDDLWFECCKTARKPYDLFVCANLIAIKYHFPETKISSDGGYADWKPAVDWYVSVFPDRDKTHLPFSDEEEEEITNEEIVSTSIQDTSNML
jgi:hypothetical protein